MLSDDIPYASLAHNWQVLQALPDAFHLQYERNDTD